MVLNRGIMTKNTFIKFIFLSHSNIKRFILINLILLVPLCVFFYTLFQLVPLAVRYIDSFNISVQEMSADYGKLAVVVISEKNKNESVYVIKRKDFNSLRKYVFLSTSDENAEHILRERALGYSDIPFYGKSLAINDKKGDRLVTLFIQGGRENTIEILFLNEKKNISKQRAFLYEVLLVMSFVLISGSLGGISDFTQRVVFHETKNFAYLCQAIETYFFRSLFVSVFFTIVIGAIATNIYFYIFIINNELSVFIAALNFWMLVFFIFILFWVYPLLILNRDESIWKVMKKSLFVSFDNFKFTLDSLLLLFLMIIFSCITFFTIPGFAGIFSFMNSALKEISYRYSRPD